MKIIQIWYGDLNSLTEYCMQTVQRYAYKNKHQYTVIYDSDQGSVEENVIKSNIKRLKIMQECTNTLYVDSDIQLKNNFTIDESEACAAWYKGYPLEALMYSGDCSFFNDIKLIEHTHGNLRRQLRKKTRNMKIIDTIPESMYIHYMQTSKNFNY